MNIQFKPYVATDTITAERQLYQAVKDAELCLKAAVRCYNAGTSINPQIDWNSIADILKDEIVGQDVFDERLSEARRGYDE